MNEGSLFPILLGQLRSESEDSESPPPPFFLEWENDCCSLLLPWEFFSSSRQGKKGEHGQKERITTPR